MQFCTFYVFGTSNALATQICVLSMLVLSGLHCTHSLKRCRQVSRNGRQLKTGAL